jgi:hypothetical protein
MSFEGTEPVISKIVINDSILEQINTLNYLCCNMSSKGEMDFNVKVEHCIKFSDHE